MMSIPSGSASDHRRRTLVVVVAVVVAVALVLGLLLGGWLSSSSPAPRTPAALGGHTGIVNDVTPVQTLPVAVGPGDLIVLFVSYVNYLAGGGAPTSITDSLSDTYALVSSTGDAYNHTESVYVASAPSGDASFLVTVTFSGGATPQGGSVAVVVVSNATASNLDGTNGTFGDGPTASVSLTVGHVGDLVLFGTAGRGVSGPYRPGPGEVLLDTGTATAGPFEDGVGYGTFWNVAGAPVVNATATLNTPTYWVALAVAIR